MRAMYPVPCILSLRMAGSDRRVPVPCTVSLPRI